MSFLDRPGVMPAITITQEGLWASLIAIGAKPYETRSWAPPPELIGQRLAIHAGMKPIRPDIVRAIRRELGQDTLTLRRLQRSGRLTAVSSLLASIEDTQRLGAIPLGAVVCTATLAGAYQLDAPIGNGHGRRAHVRAAVAGSPPVERIECDPFGGYDPEKIPDRGLRHRWAWHLTDIQVLPVPIPARGLQRLWAWSMPTASAA